jgi:RHS repeat-associated protein
MKNVTVWFFLLFILVKGFSQGDPTLPPKVRITIHQAPGTPWEQVAPFTVVLPVEAIFSTGHTGGRGIPLFVEEVREGAYFLLGEPPTGFPMRPSGPSSPRLGGTNFLAYTMDPASGQQMVWVSASQGAWGLISGNEADWEYQIRYFSGIAGSQPARLELGTVPNAGFWTFDSIAPSNYTVEIEWNAVGVVNNPAFSGFAAREILAGRNSLERAESMYADPVDVATGAQVIHHEFLRQHGLFPFSFDITGSTLQGADGPVAAGWEHNFEAVLSDDGAGLRTVHWSAMRRSEFEPIVGESGLWKGAGEFNSHDRLRLLGSGNFRHERRTGLWHVFAADGKLIRVETRSGIGADLTYQGNKLARVTDEAGGYFIGFSYDGEERIDHVWDGLGRRVDFMRDEEGRLIGFERTQGEGLPNLKCEYEYNIQGLLWRCRVGEVSEGGVLREEFVLFENEFDPAGRIKRQWGYGGRDRGVAARFGFYEDLENELIVTLVVAPKSYGVSPTWELTRDVYHGAAPLLEDGTLFIHDRKLRLVEKREDRGEVAGGRLVAVTQWAYGAGAEPVSRTSNVVMDVAWQYDSLGNRVSELTTTGKLTSWTYDPQGNLASRTDPAGGVEVYQYDGGNRLTSFTDASGGTTNYTYHGDGSVARLTDGAGLSRSFSSVGGLPGTETAPGGAQTVYGYDAAGRTLSRQEPGGRQWSYVWDDMDNLLEVVRPDGNRETYTYDCREPNRSLMTSRTDARGNLVRWEYRSDWYEAWLGPVSNWELARPLSAEEDGISRTRFLYHEDETWSVFNFAQSARRSRVIVHDAPSGYGLLPQHQLEDHEITVQEFLYRDGPVRRELETISGNSIFQTGNHSNRQRMVFDERGDLRKVIQRADLHRPLAGKGFVVRDGDYLPERLETWNGTVMREFSHDANGGLISVTDPVRGSTTFERDGLGRLLSATLPSGIRAAQTFDAAGRTLSRTAPAGGVVGFFYGNDGLLSSIQWPDETVTTLTRNANGEAIGEQWPSGRTFSIERNSMGQVSSITDLDDTTIFTLNELGQRTGVSRDGETVSSVFDARGRLVQFTEPHGNTFYFTYDVRDRLAAITYPDGAVLKYEGSHEASRSGRQIQCEAWGLNLERWRGFPEAHQLEQLNTIWKAGPMVIAAGFTRELTVERSSNNSMMLRQVEYSPSDSDSRDLFRVNVNGPGWDPFPAGWTSAGGFQSLDRPAGNSSEWKAPDSRSYERGADGRVVSVNGQTQQYDADGNLIFGMLPDGSLGGWTWDGRGLLASAGGVAYHYSPEGHAAGWTDAAGTTKFFTVPLFGRETILGMERPDGELVWFVHDEEGLLADWSSNAGVRYYFFDPAGNTIWHGASDADAASGFYEPFGELMVSVGDWETPFRYRGREGVPTASNGVVWMRARHYNPALRSFMSPDPLLGRIEQPLSLDRYAYAMNNPLAYSDPTGLAPDGEFDHVEKERPYVPRKIVGRVEMVRGGVEVVSEFNTDVWTGRQLRAGDYIFEGELIRTGSGSRVKIDRASSNGSRGPVVIGADSQIFIDGPERKVKAPDARTEPRRFTGSEDDVFQIYTPQTGGVRG